MSGITPFMAMGQNNLISDALAIVPFATKKAVIVVANHVLTMISSFGEHLKALRVALMWSVAVAVEGSCSAQLAQLSALTLHAARTSCAKVARDRPRRANCASDRPDSCSYI